MNTSEINNHPTPLDLEKIAMDTQEAIWDSGYTSDNVVREIVLIALREVAEQKDKEIERTKNEIVELRLLKRPSHIMADEEVKRLTELVEYAWGIIANAGGGNWDIESPEWKQAAERWRDEYHQLLSERNKNKSDEIEPNNPSMTDIKIG